MKKDGTVERSYTVKNLTSGKTYAFKVIAFLKEGSKTVKGKYSKEQIITPTKASKSKEFAPEKEYDFLEQIPYYANNAYDSENLSSSISVGDSISFTKTIKINAEDGNAVFDIYGANFFDDLKSSDESRYNSIFAYSKYIGTNFYDRYNELANIPILSEANKKGLEDGYTIIGTKTMDEAEKLIDSWAETSHIYDLDDPKNPVSFDRGLGGGIIIDEDTIILGNNRIDVVDDVFSEKVYEVDIVIPSFNGFNHSLDPINYSASYLSAVTTCSFITSYPYEVVTALAGNDKEVGLFADSSMKNKWIRVNDVLIYITSDGVTYFKPVD
ncbi:MAG: hypothetical protein K6F44_02165 [Lachnospiraceae bacterium]|nr:hypothetical protein [Lachnospiraceae bacterium]